METKATGPKCTCGFQFAGPGQFRNCAAFVDGEGRSGVKCPDCEKLWICENGKLILFEP